jgi:tetratricopeptide (TPR) repeat protein
MLVGMQLSLALLAKKAIDAALKFDWDTAVETNQKMLEKDPKNIDAKIRLGRAFIQSKQFNKAKKIFKEVLKTDPINQVALRNMELANKHKTETKCQTFVDTKSLLKEPGTTAELRANISAKGITSNDFFAGECLILKVKKKSVDIYKMKKNAKLMVGTIDNEDIVQKANSTLARDGNIAAFFVKGKEKMITLLVKSTLPVFRSEKQDVRPYIKKGSLEEPELEMEEAEPVIEE